MTLRVGDQVAGWKIEARLGEGGTSTVWRARKDGRAAVLKVLRPELGHDTDWRARLRREADALRAIDHPNAVAFVDAGTTEDDLPFVVMPEIKGESLHAALVRKGRFEVTQAWTTLRPIADALARAHDLGIVHRDVKPHNILIEERTQRPKLVDFGLARAHEAVPKVTATGSPIGTPAYMAPEQWWNQDVGPPADQYAFGVTLFETLTATTPFGDASFADLVQAHVSRPPPSMRERGAEVDERVVRFVLRLLEKDPKQRFASMREVIAAGDEAFQTRRPNRWPLALASLAIAYGLSTLIVFGYPRAASLAEWLRGAGVGVYVPLALYSAASILVLRRGAPLGWAAWVGVAGTLGAGTGFVVLFRTLGHYPAEAAFEIFHEGCWEANANRYVGFTLASALALAIDTRQRAAAPRRNRQLIAWLAAGAAAACLLLGARSAVIACAALALGAIAESPRHALFVIVSGAAAAATRAQALVDAPWALEPTRATRAAALATAMHERTITFVTCGVVVAAGLALAARAFARPHPSRGFSILIASWLVADVGLVLRAAAEKGAIYTHLGPEFALFSHLDPPPATNVRSEPPPLRPTLKIARDRIALDRTPIGLVSMLDSADGLGVLRADLSHRLADQEAAADVELLLMADGSVSSARVTRAMSAAYDVGVRHIGVLLLRGGPLPTGELPEEAFYALPRDFAVLRIPLGPAMVALGDLDFASSIRTMR